MSPSRQRAGLRGHPSKIAWECSGLTDRGLVRADNEDVFLIDRDLGLCIVSDGMGGGNAGSLASKIVVTVLPALLREHLKGIESLAGTAARDQLKAAMSRLSVDIRSRTEGLPGLEGMGATVVLALVRGHRVLIGHMGDSRAYRFRNGALELLTRDHSLARLLIEHGEITRDQARTHPAKDQLTRFVGMKSEPLPEIRGLELRGGDCLLLCSDGLTKMVPDRELLNILGSSQSAAEVCRTLVTAANHAGGIDNTTAVCLRVSK
ncbi:MAG TPA: protein phosphatase 2C domain-containing protein [Chthoniobacteraceae bacterium]|jgi:protein phosphatase|nr:protein phosphatase 2C domain-containing protein [Chthoniobacteraceae bacterium]